MAEAFVTAQSGLMMGKFYKALVDRDGEGFLAVLWRAALLYALTAFLISMMDFLSELLALRWRDEMTQALQQRYLEDSRFYHAVRRVDTCDQRIVADAREWSWYLGQVVKIVVAAPLKIVYYAWLTVRLVGWLGVGSSVLFFSVGAATQSAVVRPISKRVYEQERREGRFRVGHVRVQGMAESIAMVGGGRGELRSLQGLLRSVVQNQFRVVTWRWLLGWIIKMLEYGGSVLNYVVVALAVFLYRSGAPDGADDRGAGEIAQLISNSSFATLSLIWSLTQLLRTGKDVAQLSGLTFRLHDLAAELGLASRGGSPARHQDRVYEFDRRRRSLEVEMGYDGAIREAHRCSNGSAASRPDSPAPPFVGIAPSAGSAGGCDTLLPPTAARIADTDDELEVSVHALGRAFARDLRGVCPDLSWQGAGGDSDGAPSAQGWAWRRPLVERGGLRGRRVLAVPVFQFARGGQSLAPRDSLSAQEADAHVTEVEAEMDRMLRVFLSFVSRVEAELKAQGFWCSGIDPRTGLALSGRTGARYSEVRGAQALLNYAVDDRSLCPIVRHPTHGASAYPATLFTTAPASTLADVLSRICQPLAASHAPPEPQAAPTPAGREPDAAHLRISRLSCRAPADGPPVVHDLSLVLPPGRALLVTGPSGCGKSTLLNVIRGLQPPDSGSVEVLLPDRVVAWAPQRAVLAPGESTLREQLAYPSQAAGEGARGGQWEAEARRALEVARLSGLLARDAARGLDARADWTAVLSPGETQRLVAARILLARPRLVFLDEATNAVSTPDEEAFYAALRATGATVVSVSHASALQRHHDLHLHITGDGSGAWTLEQIRRASASHHAPTPPHGDPLSQQSVLFSHGSNPPTV
ncbi:unnamed protein product [Pedinophyceae sp. YPF-701]|nr:unnamed protein product [Pedinophyceae sp. YPF-701]